jgi:HAD superfamily hydrolase (TIGR01509 family)
MEQKELKLVLFDLDGVILNSEPLHDHAKRRILMEAGISDDLDLSWSVGKPSNMLWNQMRSRYGLKLTEDELEQSQYNYIMEEIKEKQIPPSEGLLELLSWLKENQIRIGLVSSSWGSFVHSVLDHYKIKYFFEYVIAGDDVERKKPFPDGYLKALRAFAIPTMNAIALEDSKTGSDAAITAQLKCIGYQNPTSGMQDLTKCHKVIVNLNQIKQIAIAF